MVRGKKKKKFKIMPNLTFNPSSSFKSLQLGNLEYKLECFLQQRLVLEVLEPRGTRELEFRHSHQNLCWVKGS